MNRLRQWLGKRAFVYGLVVAVCLANGITQTVATYDAALGMGDNSTFYAFARNIVNGEEMFEDFIHFRTPGTVTLFAGLMVLLGQEQSTIEISTRIETLVLYPLLFLMAAMILLRKRSPWYVVAAYAGFALVPGVAQLRAGFGLLAIAVYSMTFAQQRYRKQLLMASGFLAAATFFFGQEIFLMVGLCLAAGELYKLAANKWKIDARFWQRILYLSIGLAAGLVPLLLYMAIFSSLSNFLYYVTYYSFVLQPQYMNIPFPDFSYDNLFNYLPFMLYWLCFWVFITNKRMGAAEGLLLSFGILRLITATGRSDFGHFLFTLPELFLIVPYFLLQARSSQLNWKFVRRFVPHALAIGLLLWWSTKEGVALAPVPFIILLALYDRSRLRLEETMPRSKLANYNLYALIAVLFALFVYMLVPTYIAVAKATKSELFVDDSQAYRIGGVKTDEVNYRQIQAVKAAVEPLRPKTIFAFPIQPFYYSLADHHAARFLTFEPQTTVEEQDQTIADLRRAKPEVIIFDPLQAHGLSGSLWKISNHIMTNYRVIKEVNMRENLWVMMPKEQSIRDEKLVFQLFHDNTAKDIKAKAVPIQSSAQGLYNAIQEKTNKLTFKVEVPRPASLALSLRDEFGDIPDMPVCGVVVIAGAEAHREQICSDQGTVAVDLLPSRQPTSVILENPGQKSIIWNDVSVRDR